MKRKFIRPATTVALALLLINCNSSSSKDSMDKELQKDAQNALKSTSEKNQDNSSTSTASPGTLTVDAAIKFIAAADANKGKEVTVKGFPKGTTKPVNGTFMLYVSDKAGSGMAEENFACYFKEDALEQVRKFKSSELITVAGNIAYNNGMVVLKNARIAE